MTERLHFDIWLLCIGEGNGNPLQYSCLENPRDGGAWWAAIYGVTQSRTWLKRLTSSSSRYYLIIYILKYDLEIWNSTYPYFKFWKDLNENRIHRKLTNLITWTTALSNSMKLWAMLCRATQDIWVMVESSDKMWSTGEGNGKPLQYSCLENPMKSMKRQKDRTLKDGLPRW